MEENKIPNHVGTFKGRMNDAPQLMPPLSEVMKYIPLESHYMPRVQGIPQVAEADSPMVAKTMGCLIGPHSSHVGVRDVVRDISLRIALARNPILPVIPEFAEGFEIMFKVMKSKIKAKQE